LKAELETGDIEAIAQRVVELLRPLLSNNGKNEDNELLDIEQASKLLGTSKEQIYQWVSNAKYGLKPFPFLKSGKRLRFSKKDLIQWMQNNKVR
jgi:excisionase family DNA binding protein